MAEVEAAPDLGRVVLAGSDQVHVVPRYPGHQGGVAEHSLNKNRIAFDEFLSSCNPFLLLNNVSLAKNQEYHD